MQPQSVAQMSRTVLNQTVLSHLQTDNIFVQYMVSLLAISFLGFITTKVPIYVQYIQKWLQRKVVPNQPTIKFVFTKQKNSPQITGATNAVLAWLERIKESIKKYKKDDKNYETVKIIRSIATTKQYNNKTRKYHLNTHWIPDQMTPFLIDDNIFVKLHKTNLKSGSGESFSVDEYTLYISTSLGLKYLLNYHDKLVTKYEERLKSKFETVPHIFYLESYEEKTDKLIWSFNEFSSSRKMEHIWFEEKNSFINSYKNFLYKKHEYDKRGDPYTYSLMLYGPPGCGKTSLLKALINYDKDERDITSHLFVIPFSKIDTNDMFEKVMLDLSVNGTRIPMNKRIYVFEDFDASDQAQVFNIRDSLRNDESNVNPNSNGKDKTNASKKRKKIRKQAGSGQKKDAAPLPSTAAPKPDMATTLASLLKDDGSGKSSSLNLSDILNTLDGICERTGQRCIWTTNSYPPQKYFDPAFLRPGRMDMIIKLGRCTREGIYYLIKSYFDIYHNDDDIDIDHKYDDNYNGLDVDFDFKIEDLDGIDQRRFTPAQIKQICKEALSVKNAILMLEKICYPDDKKENDKDGPIIVVKNKIDAKDVIPLSSTGLIRSVSSPLAGIPEMPEISQITRLHSGHWFDKQMESIDETKLVDPKNKISTINE